MGLRGRVEARLLSLGLAAVLEGLPVDAAVAQPGQVAVVRGRVSEARDGAPIFGAQVQLVGTPIRASTGDDGRFTLVNVPLGIATLRVSALGFAPVSRPLAIDSAGAVVDVVMERAAMLLDEMVTTATGEQSRRSVPNVVGTLKADSIAQMAAVTSVDEILNSRIPGVSIRKIGGLTGATFSVRIRGRNSAQLYLEPMWIIDGVRLAEGGISTSGNIGNNVGLAAVNPEDIESIDVIKGPAAAALYGTQASNGVVVIKTRRGRAGQTAWRSYAEYGRVEQPAAWPDNWWSWGRNLVNGVPQTAKVQCRIANKAAGLCVIDSLTTFNPLRTRETTPYGDPGNRTLFGLQASGGSEKLRFYASVEREDERGPYTMPPSEVARLTSSRGVPPNERQVNPNALDQFNLRGNFTAALTPALELTLSGAFIDRRLQTPHSGASTTGIQDQALSAPGYRTSFGGYASQYLGDMMSLEVVDEENRAFVNATATWTPRPLLSARLTSGVDRGGARSWLLAKNGEGPIGWAVGGLGVVGQGGGRLVADLLRQTVTNDLLTTASWQLAPDLASRVTAGGQFIVDQWYYMESYGVNLPPGDLRFNSASTRGSTEDWNEDATLGLYAEENLAWKDRRFLTLGIRTDQNSQFGEGYPRVWYPRAGLSWVVSEEEYFPKASWLGSLRLRGAWGRAGIPPGATTALQTLSSGIIVSGGQVLATLSPSSLGNPELKPEVVSELELGIDLQLFQGRLAVEATRYDKTSRNGINTVQLPPSLGGPSFRTVNIASVRNRGLELGLDVSAIRTASLSWDLRLTGSTLDNEALDLGAQALALQASTSTSRTVQGYPVQGFWARPITGYADANGDGILVAGEITSDTAWRYVGPNLPTREVALTSTLNMLHDQLSVMTMLDYRGGYYKWWSQEQIRCGGGNCRGVNDPAAPLEEQAAAVASQSAVHNFTNAGYLKPADFLRLREVSVAWSLPPRMTRTLRASTARLVVAGRNLIMINKRYAGMDPEASSGVEDTKWNIPPLRYWTVRLNLGR